MTETPEEVRHVTELPIFVWSGVLLPYEKTLESIHVEKPADCRMLADITFTDRLFGVTNRYLVDKETGLPYIGGIGCIARLLESDIFRSGDANIKMQGISRYRVQGFVETDKPYPVAKITFLNDVEEDEEEIERLTRETCVLAQRVITRIMHALGSSDYEAPLMSPEIDFFSFMAAPLFSLDLGGRLKFLQAQHASTRLRFAIDSLKLKEAAVEDNISRKEFIKRFQNTKNTPNFG